MYVCVFTHVLWVEDQALNNLQGFISHKTRATKRKY